MGGHDPRRRRDLAGRLATCVTNLVTRHPSITASAAASVDAAAGGRTILGIGRRA